MVEGSGGLGLSAESGLEGRVAGEVWPQDLDGDAAAEADVAAFPDFGHATAANDLDELVAVAEHASGTGFLRHAPYLPSLDAPVSQEVPHAPGVTRAT